MQLLDRTMMLKRLATLAFWATAQQNANAFSSPNRAQGVVPALPNQDDEAKVATVAYKSFTLPINDYGVNVPVAAWFPATEWDAEESTQIKTPSYSHRISVRRIGQLLAGWDFIPGLVARDFSLSPSNEYVTDGTSADLPGSCPIILLAHGYLGSRFDLSHLAEALALEGFTCLSAEYPESLSASYDRMEGLDRGVINDALLQYLASENKNPTKFGIIGHSLGCGTVLRTGDESWARVCVAGFPRNRDGTVVPGNVLFVSSMNDGAVSPARFGGAAAFPKDLPMLNEEESFGTERTLPSRAAILYDKPNSPNHISFLSESVNDAMIDFLSGLLPVARAFSIPMLDFDKYQVSRDSRQTAKLVHPLIIQYMKQEMRK